METLAKYFLVFALFVGNFSNKHHYNLLKILRIFCLWYFCPKWLIPELFVLKVDLCIKVVALIKITTVLCIHRTQQSFLKRIKTPESQKFSKSRSKLFLTFSNVSDFFALFIFPNQKKKQKTHLDPKNFQIPKKFEQFGCLVLINLWSNQRKHSVGNCISGTWQTTN